MKIIMEVKKNYILQRVRETVLVTNIPLPNRLQPASLFLEP